MVAHLGTIRRLVGISSTSLGALWTGISREAALLGGLSGKALVRLSKGDLGAKSIALLIVMGGASAGVFVHHQQNHRSADAARMAALQAQLAQTQAEAVQAKARMAAMIAEQNNIGQDATTRLTQLEAELQRVTRQAQQTKVLYQKKAKESTKLHEDQVRLQTEIARLQQEKEAAVREAKRLRMVAAERNRAVASSDGTQGGAATIASGGEGALDGDTAAGAQRHFTFSDMMRQLGMRAHDEGGPFIPLHGATPPRLSAAALKLLHTLPLSAPLTQYQLESPFGARIDPINGSESFHPGIDLSAPYRSPVYNTGPGTVIFAGWASSYGRMVEIDHGHGIHTRYAHLYRVTVNVGQRLTHRVRIGLLGSTGRSTGPHVHYEVDVDGQAQDPQSFLAVGRTISRVRATE